MVTQGVGGTEPGSRRDLLNRHPARFQQIAGLRHAFLKHQLAGDTPVASSNRNQDARDCYKILAGVYLHTDPRTRLVNPIVVR